MNYPIKKTGLLLLDPYNDFLAPEGKLWPHAKEVAEEVNLLVNLKSLMDTARRIKMQIFFVPHHRWVPGDFLRWKYPSNTQVASGKRRTFEKGTFGGTFHKDFEPQQDDIIIQEHWAQSGFANTDLAQLAQLEVSFGDFTRSGVSRINGLVVAEGRFERVVTTLGIFFHGGSSCDGACICATRFAGRTARFTVIGAWFAAFA